MDKKRDGFAIALAWPETFCKQSSAWYDPVMRLLKITQNNYYQVGHSAVVLVNKKGECWYYDFGRYHAPYSFGRVRSAHTDSELNLITTAKFKNNRIDNLEEIISELALKKACHGEGTLHSSYTSIDFEKAKNKAEEMQNNSPLKYGPFIFNGTNCSRFVRNVILAGNPKLLSWLKMSIQYTLTASPRLNVAALPNKLIFKSEEIPPNVPAKSDLKSVLKSPAERPHLSAKWFAGEGAGSWFLLEKKRENLYLVKRFSADLQMECSREMTLQSDHSEFNSNAEYSLTYPSHSKSVTINQNNRRFILHH